MSSPTPMNSNNDSGDASRILTNRINSRACPVCGSTACSNFAEERIDPGKISDFTYASRKNPEFMRLRLVRCSNCDLVYAPTPPSSGALNVAYSEAAFDSASEAIDAARSYAAALKPHINKLPSRSAAVDVGAGSGPLLPWLVENGFEKVIGIEPSSSAIKAASPQIRSLLREGMFAPSLLQDVTPALVCSFMTLEHVPAPDELINTAYQILEPGGMVAIVVHNWRAPLNRVLHLRSPIIDIEHLQLFSPKSLRKILENAGFSSISLQSITNTYPLGYWLRLTPFPEKIKIFLCRLLEKLGLIDKKISLRVGNMLAIGIKPIKEEK